MSRDVTGPTSSRRAVLGQILLVPAAGLLAGCTGCTGTSSTPQPGTSAATAESDRTVRDEQRVADQLSEAVRTGDVAAYRRLIGGGDAAFAATADQLWRNLTGLAPETFALTVSARREPLTATRRGLLGADALATETTLTWSVGATPRPARTIVWLTFTGSGGEVRWAGRGDRPDQSGSVLPVPVWWTEPVEVDRGTDGVLIRASAVPAPRSSSWASVVQTALTHARRRVPATTPGPWIVQLPATASEFESATGQRAAGSLAALTVSAGPDPTTAPAQVVLNPDTAAQPVDRIGFTLTHELVHVLLDAPARPGPLWVEEGTADAVAFDAYPALAAAELTRLARGLGGQAPALPGNGAFDPADNDLDTVYAQAWSACRFVVERRDWATLLTIGTQLADDPQRAWWTTAGFGSLREFQRAWATWLRRTAG